MKMFVALALFEGCPRSWLDDAAALRAALESACHAGPFNVHDLSTVRFSPQGVTACAIVSESHLSLHSWPEEGCLFVDIASCSSRASVRNALAAIASAMPAGRQVCCDEREVG
jgi:S-adenosylmethionine decarboxylase